MIHNNRTFLSGEKDLFTTFISFFVLGVFFYSLISFSIGYLLLKFYPFALCSLECTKSSDIVISFNLTYYLGNIFIITTSSLIMFSSYVLWINSKNTYNTYSVYSAKIFSAGMAFSSFIFFLWGIWSILIPENHLERIIPDLMFNNDGLSYFWSFFVTNK